MQIKRRNTTIFSKHKISKKTEIPYDAFRMADRLNEDDKEKIRQVIEKDTCKLLGGSYKLVKSTPIDSDSNSNNADS